MKETIAVTIFGGILAFTWFYAQFKADAVCQSKLADTTASLAACEEELAVCRDNGFSPYSR